MPNYDATIPLNSPVEPPTLVIDGEACPILDQPIPTQWAETAAAKGFDIAARIEDRYHVALRCHDCGGLTRTKAYTLRTNQPICQPCLKARREATAQAAGLTFLRRDPDDTQYAWYRMGCGHEVRRQFGLTQRVANGDHGLRCRVCHARTEQEEARSQGWELVGPDPEGDANYRLYRHADGCGQVQRIARANLQTGRFDCQHCGAQWPAAPNAIYLMRFTLRDGSVVVKLGHARKPHSRLRHQLLRDKTLPAELLRIVPVESGHLACQLEKRLHAQLRRDVPGAVVPRKRFAKVLKVGSEIYEDWLMEYLHRQLDQIAARAMRRTPA